MLGKMKKYVAVEGCDKCNLGYIYHICQKCGGDGCLYCRQGETVEVCSCNSKPYQEYFEEPE
jgi:hypothetical protein